MLRRLALVFLLPCGVLFITCAGLQAQENGKEKAQEKGKTQAQEKELPPSGTLSTAVTAGYQSRKVDGVWGSDDFSSDTKPPISGSVSRFSANEWLMKVTNNSETSYSVALEVVQYGGGGQRVKSDSFSYTLAPGDSQERRLRAGANVASADLKLSSWKRLDKKKK